MAEGIAEGGSRVIPSPAMPTSPPSPLPDSDRSCWSLPEDWAFLNPGSFGLRLRDVQAARADLLARWEAQPVDFIERVSPGLYASALDQTAQFVGADAAGFGFVSNATEGIDAVLASHAAARDGAILIGDQAYGAVAAASRWVTRAAGEDAVRRVRVDLPVESAHDITSSWREALQGGGVALAIVDHVTSGTALVQPVSEIVAVCGEFGVPVLVDGAHAPGMLDLDINSVGADWYAGKLHKWSGAPSGAGFLWTAARHRGTTRPLALSHEANDGYEPAFMWQGTRDYTPWLTVPAAIDAIEQRWGWKNVRSWQHAMACWAGGTLAEAIGSYASDGTGGTLTAAMVSVKLPDLYRKRYEDRFVLRDLIARDHRVEIAIDDTVGDWWLRMSFGPWARAEDVQRVQDALAATA